MHLLCDRHPIDQDQDSNPIARIQDGPDALQSITIEADQNLLTGMELREVAPKSRTNPDHVFCDLTLGHRLELGKHAQRLPSGAVQQDCGRPHDDGRICAH